MVSAPRRSERPDAGRARQADLEDHPWLESVSEDRTTWTVRDVTGGRTRPVRIGLDIEFEDGTRLPDPENQELFDVGIEYLQIVRLYQPVIGPTIHQGRVMALLTFYYWLNQRAIRSLADVTPDHIELFTKECEFGREWVLKCPHRLIEFIQSRIRQGVELPVADDNRLDLAKIRKEAKLQWPVSRNSPACGKITRWLIANHPTMDSEKTAEELIAEHGWKPNRQTTQSIHRAVVPIEELWRWKEHFCRPVLGFNPFPEGAGAKAVEIGTEPKRHPTVPPSIAFPYLREALRWIIEYAPVIVEGRASEASAAQVQERLARLRQLTMCFGDFLE